MICAKPCARFVLIFQKTPTAAMQQTALILKSSLAHSPQGAGLVMPRLIKRLPAVSLHTALYTNPILLSRGLFHLAMGRCWRLAMTPIFTLKCLFCDPKPEARPVCRVKDLTQIAKAHQVFARFSGVIDPERCERVSK